MSASGALVSLWGLLGTPRLYSDRHKNLGADIGGRKICVDRQLSSIDAAATLLPCCQTMRELNRRPTAETDRARLIAAWLLTLWAIEAMGGFAAGFTYPWLVWFRLIPDVF